MEKKFTGSSTISQILSEYGKIVDDGKQKKLVLSITATSSKSVVALGANVTKEDMRTALSELTPLEKAAVSKFELLAKQAAATRTAGATADRWKSDVRITKLVLA